ncbi:hypothetical protein M9H77_08409 [Catharanthus roseus]|uniref:Uncharacterized protein n=1 Tax=Catharanthus roseus TaxID=4058 RepID=A0ACC0BXZ3_CATRO|nr:hypothetical protein M9H77_08409 [Catharanthus roseus]
MQQFIKGLARQFQSVDRDVEKLKKGKSSATMKQRVGDNLGGFNSPHHQSLMIMYLLMDIMTYRANILIPFMTLDIKEGHKGYHRPQEEYPRQQVWNDDNFYGDYGDNPNLGQAYHGGNVMPKPKVSTYKSWQKKEDTPKVAFKDHSKPRVEEKGKLITNPTRCFKCNGGGILLKMILPK